MDRRVQRAIERLDAGGRVLVTRLEYLGDAILTLPVVDALRTRFPVAEIDYLCRPPADGVLASDSRISRVFSVVRGGGVRHEAATVAAMRRRNYAVTIDLYANPRSAWMTRASGAGVRIGGDRRGRRRLYTHPVTVEKNIRSSIEFHLRHLRPLGINAEPVRPSLDVGEDERAAAASMLRRLGLRPGRRCVGLHPGGKWTVKRWPVERFAELARIVHTELDCSVVLLTGPSEPELTRETADRSDIPVVVVPPVSARSLAAVLARLDGVAVSDGGVMHLSVAVGTPTVGIFGSAEPDVWFPYETWGPYRAASLDLDCRPCHRHVCPLGHTHCLNRLDPGTVASLLSEVVKGHTDSGGSE